MEEVSISEFVRNYKKIIRKIPAEGINLTLHEKVKAVLHRPNYKVMRQEVIAKAEESLESMKQIDTFTQVPAPKSVKLGICSRCGRHGPVNQKNFLDKEGRVIYDKYVCTMCYSGEGKKINPLKDRVDVKEMTGNSGIGKKQSDFGGSNEHGTF